MIYPLRVWIYSVCSRDFSVRSIGEEICVDLVFRMGVVPASVYVVSSCFWVRSFPDVSSIHVLQFPTYGCAQKRQTVFFTAVNPMHENHKDPQELDLTKPRLALYKQKWKRHQDTVCWVGVQLAQRKGLKFCQTRCNTIILYDTPAYCISKVVVMVSGEIKYQKVYVSPRPPPVRLGF